jgi:hypothetical protein
MVSFTCIVYKCSLRQKEVLKIIIVLLSQLLSQGQCHSVIHIDVYQG